MSYRPITDVWMLARAKVKYYGAYPGGFLERARALLGVTINDPVLHVCSGKVRDYPYFGVGPEDRTVDVREDLAPDFVVDVASSPLSHEGWAAVLADPPYTDEDAKQYGGHKLPSPSELLVKCLAVVRPGGRVGMLHYVAPRPPRNGVKFVACIAVMCGFNNRMRCFSVYEKREVAPTESPAHTHAPYQAES